MVFSGVEVAGKRDEEPSTWLQDTVALGERCANVLDVLKDVERQDSSCTCSLTSAT